MKERLKFLAEELSTGKKALNIYKELAQVFHENCLFHEEGAIYEKIWHITQDHELYKKIGDIFFYNVRNKDISVKAYHRFLQHSMPEFYRSYADNLSQIGLKDFKYVPDDEDYSRELVDLCDRYNAVVYIMICLLKNKEYDAVLELKKCLYSIKERIDKINITSDEDRDTIQDTKDSDRHLSEIISETEHHNDLNLFAIKLYPDNQRAYINIIGDYITYANYDEAILYFNTYYSPKYNIQPMFNPAEICWVVSDYYRDRFEFYNAVYYQKIALEIDLSKQEN